MNVLRTLTAVTSMPIAVTHQEITLVLATLDSLVMASVAVVKLTLPINVLAIICHVMIIIDFNECLNGTDNNCDSMNSECNNTFGGFECYCRDGYRDNGTYCESM